EHPAAKMLVEVAKTQDEEAGDGTTTAVVLAGELLKRAEDLIEQNIHPTVIAAGYRQAADKAREVLEKVAMKISVKDLDTLKKVALVDAALEVKKTEIDAKIEITDPTQLQAFLNEEEGMLKRMVETVRKSGANVLFCQKGIDDLAQHYLAKQDIYAVRRVKKSD